MGLGVKVGKEVANSIRGAILDGKMQVIPVRRGYWGRKIGTLVSEFASVSMMSCVFFLQKQKIATRYIFTGYLRTLLSEFASVSL